MDSSFSDNERLYHHQRQDVIELLETPNRSDIKHLSNPHPYHKDEIINILSSNEKMDHASPMSYNYFDNTNFHSKELDYSNHIDGSPLYIWDDELDDEYDDLLDRSPMFVRGSKTTDGIAQGGKSDRNDGASTEDEKAVFPDDEASDSEVRIYTLSNEEDDSVLLDDSQRAPNDRYELRAFGESEDVENINLCTKTRTSPQNGRFISAASKFYHVYLLRSLSPFHPMSTYIGYTTNPRRRLRQHNGNTVGGARRTAMGGGRKRPWGFAVIVGNLPSKREALQLEWAWQHIENTRFLKGDKEAEAKKRCSVETAGRRQNSSDDESSLPLPPMPPEDRLKLARKYGVQAKFRQLANLLCREPFLKMNLELYFFGDYDISPQNSTKNTNKDQISLRKMWETEFTQTFYSNNQSMLNKKDFSFHHRIFSAKNEEHMPWKKYEMKSSFTRSKKRENSALQPNFQELSGIQDMPISEDIAQKKGKEPDVDLDTITKETHQKDIETRFFFNTEDWGTISNDLNKENLDIASSNVRCGICKKDIVDALPIRCVTNNSSNIQGCYAPYHVSCLAEHLLKFSRSSIVTAFPKSGPCFSCGVTISWAKAMMERRRAVNAGASSYYGFENNKNSSMMSSKEKCSEPKHDDISNHVYSDVGDNFFSNKKKAQITHNLNNKYSTEIQKQINDISIDMSFISLSGDDD